MNDLLGAGEFASKLADLAGQFVGGALRPTQIKRVALAEAEAKITNAKADIAIENLKTAATDVAVQQDVLRRSLTRLAAQEVRRQLNMESVVKEAGRNPFEIVSREPVDDAWASAFFEGCQDISDLEMQRVWARLLASEVAAPGTVSRRLLNAVALLSPTEARSFQQLCLEIFSRDPHSFEPKMLFFSMGDVSIGGIDVEPFNLVQFVPEAGRFVYSMSSMKEVMFSEFYGRKVRIKQDIEKRRHGSAIIIRPLTQTGIELARIISPSGAPALDCALTTRFSELGVSLTFDV